MGQSVSFTLRQYVCRLELILRVLRTEEKRPRKTVMMSAVRCDCYFTRAFYV
jgi:hypothetical protein